MTFLFPADATLDTHQPAFFLTSYGEPFNPDVLSRMVTKFIKPKSTAPAAGRIH